MNRHIILYIPILLFLIYGCGFNDPYVPDSVGSSTLKGKIFADQATDISETEIILRGEESISTLTDSYGNFIIKDIIPGNYALQIQKSPYIQTNLSVVIPKDSEIDLGEVKVNLLGAMSANIPSNKIGTLYGEFEIVVYVNGVPRVPERNSNGEFMIDLSSTETDINIRTVTKTIVYIDGTSYSAKVLDDGEIFVEFIPPGIYTDISIKLNTSNGKLPISSSPVVIKSGEVRSIFLGS